MTILVFTLFFSHLPCFLFFFNSVQNVSKKWCHVQLSLSRCIFVCHVTDHISVHARGVIHSVWSKFLVAGDSSRIESVTQQQCGYFIIIFVFPFDFE